MSFFLHPLRCFSREITSRQCWLRACMWSIKQVIVLSSPMHCRVREVQSQTANNGSGQDFTLSRLVLSGTNSAKVERSLECVVMSNVQGIMMWNGCRSLEEAQSEAVGKNSLIGMDVGVKMPKADQTLRMQQWKQRSRFSMRTRGPILLQIGQTVDANGARR